MVKYINSTRFLFLLSVSFVTFNGANTIVPERLLINKVIVVNSKIGKNALVSVNLILTGRDLEQEV